MITLEIGHLISKAIIAILVVVFIVAIRKNKLNSSEMIVYLFVFVELSISQLLLNYANFYVFYLQMAIVCVALLIASMACHALLKIEHSKLTLAVYFLIAMQFFSHMIIHRVRVVIYDTDEPILWLINSYSFVTVVCDVLIIMFLVVRVYGWKLPYTYFLRQSQ